MPRSPRMASVGTTVGRMVRGTKAGQLGTADSGPRTPPSPAPGGQGWHRAGPGCRPAPAGPMAQAEQERRRGLRAELWPQEGLMHGPRPTSLGRHLGAGEDDGFLQVFQHKGKHGGGESHGVGAVEDDEAVVLLVVCLQGGGRPQAGRPSPLPASRGPAPGGLCPGNREGPAAGGAGARAPWDPGHGRLSLETSCCPGPQPPCSPRARAASSRPFPTTPLSM